MAATDTRFAITRIGIRHAQSLTYKISKTIWTNKAVDADILAGARTIVRISFAGQLIFPV